MGKKIGQKILRILSLPIDDGGCGWYRVKQPFEFIKRFTPHDPYIVDAFKDDMVEIARAFFLTDVILMRPGSELGLEKILEIPELSKVNAKKVIDIDDNVETISPYSQHYKEYGTKEFYDNNSKMWLWKDGENDWSIAINRERIINHLRGLKNADLVTVTTPKLVEYAKQYNNNVTILPNCINFERWWSLPLRPNKQLRVGWAGGVSHYEDFYEIREPFNQLLREYQFKFISVGSYFQGIIDEDNRHLCEFQDWVPFKAHSYRLMCLNLDVAIIPLANLPFNNYKSAVKWYEMSAMGVPSVVANFTPYKEEIKDGENAMAYTTPKGFYDALKILLELPEKRKEIGVKAMEWVRQNRDQKKNIHLWTDAYSQVIDKK